MKSLPSGFQTNQFLYFEARITQHNIYVILAFFCFATGLGFIFAFPFMGWWCFLIGVCVLLCGALLFYLFRYAKKDTVSLTHNGSEQILTIQRSGKTEEHIIVGSRFRWSFYPAGSTKNLTTQQRRYHLELLTEEKEHILLTQHPLFLEDPVDWKFHGERYQQLRELYSAREIDIASGLLRLKEELKS